MVFELIISVTASDFPQESRIDPKHLRIPKVQLIVSSQLRDTYPLSRHHNVTQLPPKIKMFRKVNFTCVLLVWALHK